MIIGRAHARSTSFTGVSLLRSEGAASPSSVQLRKIETISKIDSILGRVERLISDKREEKPSMTREEKQAFSTAAVTTRIRAQSMAQGEFSLLSQDIVKRTLGRKFNLDEQDGPHDDFKHCDTMQRPYLASDAVTTSTKLYKATSLVNKGSGGLSKELLAKGLYGEVGSRKSSDLLLGHARIQSLGSSK